MQRAEPIAVDGDPRVSADREAKSMFVRKRSVWIVGAVLLLGTFSGIFPVARAVAQSPLAPAPDPSSEAIARWLAEVREPGGQRPWLAARELAERDDAGRAALESLLYEPNERVRTIAGETVLAVAPEYAVGMLLRATASDDPDVRLWAAARAERVDAAALEPFLADFDAWLEASLDASVWVPWVGPNENALRVAWQAREGDARRRAGLALALCPRPAPARELVATVLEALGDRADPVRRTAAKVLAIQRHRAWLEHDDLVAGIRRATRDADPVVREFACRALVESRLGRIDAIEVLRERLGDERPEVRFAAIEAIRGVVRPIRRVDRATDAELREEAAVRSREDEWLAAVVTAVDTLADPALRHDAVAGLADWGQPFGRASEPAAEVSRAEAERRLAAALVRWLDDPSLDVALVAVEALAERRIPAGDAAIRARLIEHARSTDMRGRAIALHGLRGVAGATGEGPHPDVVALFESSEGPPRAIAWILLGDDRPHPEATARDGLVEMVASFVEHEALRSASLAALGSLGPEVVVPYAVAIVESVDANARLRRQAVQALQRIGHAAAEAAPVLRERLAGGEARVDILLEDVLKGLDSSPRECLDTRIALAASCLDGVSGSDIGPRLRARGPRVDLALDVEGLEIILELWAQESGRLDPSPLLEVVRGARSIEVAERLHEALRDDRSEVATFAAIALASAFQVSERARLEAFDRVVESTRHPHPLVRRAAVSALASHRIDFPGRTSALLAASADPDAEVRRRAMLGFGAADPARDPSEDVSMRLIERLDDASRRHRAKACAILGRSPYRSELARTIVRGWEVESDSYRAAALRYLGSASVLADDLVDAYARLLRTGAASDLGTLVQTPKWSESLEPASLESVVDVILREAFERDPISNLLIVSAQRLTTDLERILPHLRRAAAADERIAFVTRPYIESADPAARVARRGTSWFDPNMEHPSIRAFEEYRVDPASLAVWCLRSEGDRRRRAIEWLGETRTRLARAVLPELDAWFLGAEDEAIGRALRVAEGRDASADVASDVARLRNGDDATRAEAAASLGAMADQAAPAIPALIDALASDDETLREHAATALVQIGRPAIPALLEALTDVRFPNLDDAATALERLAPLPVVAADVLFDEYRNSIVGRREELAKWLIASGDVGLRRLIEYEAGNVALPKMLGAFARRDSRAFVERLGSVLADPAWSTAAQRSVVEAFEACYFGGIPPLAARLDQRRPSDDPELLRAILRTIRDHAFRVRESDVTGRAPFERTVWPEGLDVDVALTRAAFGVATPEVTNAVARALDSDDPTIRLDAARALARVGSPADDSLVESAATRLVDSIAPGRGSLQDVLPGAIGALGVSGVEALCAKLDEELDAHESEGRPSVTWERQRFVDRMTDAIGNAAKSDEAAVRRAAVVLVRAIRLEDSFSRPAWDALVRLCGSLSSLESEATWRRISDGLDDEARGYLAMAVVSRTHGARDYPRAIVEGLADALASESLRDGALRTLGRLREHATIAVPALLRLVPRDADEAAVIVATLRSIATTDSRVFDTVFGRLADPRWSDAVAKELPGWIRSSLEADRVTRHAIDVGREPQAPAAVRTSVVRLAFALGRSGDLADEDWVRRLFDDEDVAVRRAVIEACRESRRRAKSDLLFAHDAAIWRRTLADEDAGIRAIAIEFASEVARRNLLDCRDVVAAALADPEAGVVTAALDVVRGLRECTPGQLELVLSLADHPAAEVRRGVVRALERFDFERKRIDAVLERLAADTDLRVADPAAAAVDRE